ncbi:MAG TPA: HAMP domain-containing sensor histidine kinase [Candidatus Nitrosocosmicus sp.]|nr:HAMP domain-containing sensor histidine kinase [Candidatus Nitrosocosmicus sp.]
MFTSIKHITDTHRTKDDLYLYSKKYDTFPLFNNIPHLKNRSKDELKHFIHHYIFAIFISLVALIIQIYLLPFVDQKTPFLLFFPAVTLSAWYGGLRPGILTTILSLILAAYYLIPPYHSLLITNIPSLVQLFLFAMSSSLISIALEKSKRIDETKEYRLREKDYVMELKKLREEQIIAKEEIKARDEFLSLTSHELKTPLTSMLLQLQTIIHNIRNVSLAEFSVENLMKMLENGELQVKRLSKMINDMLNVSLITTGRLELEIEEMDLSQVVRDVVTSFSERAKKEGYTLTLDANTPVIGHWDKLRIEQVVTNLLSNAIKYGNQQPIHIQVEKNSSEARLVVKDQGIGISQEHQELIFQRFARAVSGKEFKGLGIGLYITKQIIERHNGRIKVQSKPKRGSTFIVELPLKTSKP